VYLRLLVALVGLGISSVANSQQEQIPDAPPPSISRVADATSTPGFSESSSALDIAGTPHAAFSLAFAQAGQSGQSTTQSNNRMGPSPNVPVDANGNPIPLDRRQPQRILGFMPNFRSVSGGAKPPPPGWKNNFIVATRQATDYSSFIFLGLTSITAEGMNMHPALGKGIGGFYAYTWRGFLDKTDNTYLSAWLLPSLLHEDTRFYALGNEHSIVVRELYVISRQAVARTYGGRQTPNIAGLGGKVLTQVVSRYYYPPSASTFGVLASKFGYSVMRDVIFSSIREFYPDIAAHYIRKHREKIARQTAAGAPSAP
jgi:hypothetical protein